MALKKPNPNIYFIFKHLCLNKQCYALKNYNHFILASHKCIIKQKKQTNEKKKSVMNTSIKNLSFKEQRALLSMCVWVIIQKWIYLPALQWSSNISVNHMVTIWRLECHTKKPSTLEKSSKPA